MQRPDKNQFLKNFYEWIMMLIIAGIALFIIRSFVFSTAKIDGNSMEPTLFHGDRVIVSRFAYWFAEPRYYDIIAFPYKENPGEYYVKRIIGLPGDEVDLVDYRFIVNGQALEDAFSEEPIYALGDVAFPVTVPDDSYFVMGDNRNVTKDSRYTSVGFIAKKDIMGKVNLRIWPAGRFGFVNGNGMRE